MLALTFWLFISVMTAWAVHHLWCGMIPAKTVNLILLPGTLVAKLGQILGLLVTGSTVRNTTLLDESGPEGHGHESRVDTRIPFIGPIFVALLPLVGCGIAIIVLTDQIGRPLLSNLTFRPVGPELPGSIAAAWQLLRDQIKLVESTTSAIMHTDATSWATWLFFYLLICLTVRMSPLPGNERGAVGAVVTLSSLCAGITMVVSLSSHHVQIAWAVLNMIVATLFALLFFTAIIRGGVGIAQLLKTNA